MSSKQGLVSCDRSSSLADIFRYLNHAVNSPVYHLLRDLPPAVSGGNEHLIEASRLVLKRCVHALEVSPAILNGIEVG